MRILGIDMGYRRIGVWMGEIHPPTGTIVTQYAKCIDLDATPFFWQHIPNIVPVIFEVAVPYGTLGKYTLLTERLLGLIIGMKYSPVTWERVYFITRPTVKSILLNTPKGTDKDVRLALQQIYPSLSERDKRITRDVWSAIAVAHAGAVLLQGEHYERMRRMPSLTDILWNNRFEWNESELQRLLEEGEKAEL